MQIGGRSSLDGVNEGKQAIVSSYAGTGVVGAHLLMAESPDRLSVLIQNQSAAPIYLDIGDNAGTGALELWEGDVLELEYQSDRKACEWTGRVYEVGMGVGQTVMITEIRRFRP